MAVAYNVRQVLAAEENELVSTCWKKGLLVDHQIIKEQIAASYGRREFSAWIENVAR